MPKIIKYERFNALTPKQHKSLQEAFEDGLSCAAIAEIIQKEWELYQHLKPSTLERQLQRLRVEKRLMEEGVPLIDEAKEQKFIEPLDIMEQNLRLMMDQLNRAILLSGKTGNNYLRILKYSERVQQYARDIARLQLATGVFNKPKYLDKREVDNFSEDYIHIPISQVEEFLAETIREVEAANAIYAEDSEEQYD